VLAVSIKVSVIPARFGCQEKYRGKFLLNLSTDFAD